MYRFFSRSGSGRGWVRVTPLQFSVPGPIPLPLTGRSELSEFGDMGCDGDCGEGTPFLGVPEGMTRRGGTGRESAVRVCTGRGGATGTCIRLAPPGGGSGRECLLDPL